MCLLIDLCDGDSFIKSGLLSSNLQTVISTLVGVHFNKFLTNIFSRVSPPKLSYRIFPLNISLISWYILYILIWESLLDTLNKWYLCVANYTVFFIFLLTFNHGSCLLLLWFFFFFFNSDLVFLKNCLWKFFDASIGLCSSWGEFHLLLLVVCGHYQPRSLSIKLSSWAFLDSIHCYHSSDHKPM